MTETDTDGRTPEERAAKLRELGIPAQPAPPAPPAAPQPRQLVLRLGGDPKSLQAALGAHPDYRLATAYEHYSPLLGLGAGFVSYMIVGGWRQVAERTQQRDALSARINGREPPPQAVLTWDISPLLFGLLVALVVIACSRTTVAVLERRE